MTCPAPADLSPDFACKARIVAEDFAGMRAQGFGLAHRAGLDAVLAPVRVRRLWHRVPQKLWPLPLRAVHPIEGGAHDELLISVGGLGGRIGRALKRRDHQALVQIQNPRMRLDAFDLIVANVHDGLRGPNVVSVRNALHGVTLDVLAHARHAWSARLRPDGRPLVSVLVGGANGRFRFGVSEAVTLGADLRAMAERDGARIVLTPSRRTDPQAVAVLRAALEPLGGVVWNGEGDNPYLGLLACADMIVVTMDSVSMVSEAVATAAPVMVAPLPGSSKRINRFLETLRSAGRVRMLEPRFASWQVSPLDDTAMAAEEMRARLGLH
ncbi:mitochondrial fission ELM1 family protein [Tanticharoenia sakaeratensis]|uniref:DUF1022 domain-containing protein n=1 Tax=Tanticharoenia sakaeratensis NBRC 103193 TaxID=1231623 RepID=A0A0D6MIS1_9PROT|nr:mitochondrial fission ELM1 family protein [Tanticharoenia sakaeratensis]GAN53381.1 hypothetical protein Tasa_009_176 [Tanticharoenia sakaeratensis NBRC 103193]GBQ20809.1 hypothetical protein AA103193_1512 [Tanticharoenia sakaeratensis NBRC 103193]